jgi:cell fate regulator YaaT (PSP1 superfamily)
MEDNEIKITETVHDEAENGAAADGIIPEHFAEENQDIILDDPAENENVVYEAEVDADGEVLLEEKKADETETDSAAEGPEEQEDSRLPAEAETVPADVSPEQKEEIPEAGPVTVVGVRFRAAGKIYYFSPGPLQVRTGMHVIAETAKGTDYGTIASAPISLLNSQLKQPLRPVLRIATAEDDARNDENREKEKKAFKICQEKIEKHGLEMKLISAEYSFDGSKIMFFFTADGRIDFRDLVKDLAGVFRTRIELRQIGVRDETRNLGGYGICGRPLCCASYLSDFIPVSIKMAKEQNLSLNPAKISGVCGRLMCCLKNEEDTYEELNRSLPGNGDEVEGNDGLRGEVISVDVLRQTIRIIVEVNDEKEIHQYGVGEFTIIRKRRRGAPRTTLKRDNDSRNGEHAGRPGHPEGRGNETAENGKNGQENGGGNNAGRRGRREPFGRDRSGGRNGDRAVPADAQEHTERPENADRPERPENTSRPERPDRPEGRSRRHGRHGGRNENAAAGVQPAAENRTDGAPAGNAE